MKENSISQLSEFDLSTVKLQISNEQDIIQKDDVFLPQINKRFDSYKEMIAEIRKSIINKKLLSATHDKESINDVRLTISTNDMFEAIYETCDTAIEIDDKFNSQIYIYHPDQKIMISNMAFFEKIVTDVSFNYNEKGKQLRIQLIVDDVAKVTQKLIKKLSRTSFMRKLISIPNYYIVTKNDIVVDIKHQKLLSLDDISRRYDIISKLPIQYLPKQLLTNNIKSKVLLYEEIINRIFTDWSSNQDDVKLLLFQIVYSILQHDNHNKCIIIKGPGGNGKSAFMKILSKIAGEMNTVYANIHQFGDPNSINQISKVTRVIIGDDAATNHKLSDTALSNLKSIVTGDPLSLPVKYMNNVTVWSNALFIQGTNTDISFFENNPALKSRMIVINWTQTNFRSEKPSDITFNLDDLIEDHLFIDTLATYCIDKIKNFNQFTIPESVNKSTEEMIESNDTIQHFLEDVYDQIDGFKYLPMSILYEAFRSWSKMYNPSSGIMKFQTFTKSLSRYTEKYKFEISHRDQRKQFKSKPQMSSLCLILDLDIDQINLQNKQLYLITNKPITNEELDNLDIDKIDVHNISDRTMQCLILLAHEYKRSDVMSRFSQYF